MNSLSLLMGAIYFAFHIYGDFSGYSDIAIGTSKLFGFNLKQNFAFPYFSRDIAEFWRRWHISLSTWFRDYLYIPLGGNRGKRHRVYFNIFITFLLSGLWHGAQVTFLIWGALHGLVLIIEKSVNIHVNKWLAIPSVFFLVIFFLTWSTFIQKVSSQSTKTGFAPSSTIAPIVATKVFAAVIISSPCFTSIVFKLNLIASVPEFTPTAYLVPISFANFFSKSIFCLVTVSIFFLQINSSIVPFIKEKIFKTNNYQNLYTFDGYYNFYNYSSIKKI